MFKKIERKWGYYRVLWRTKKYCLKLLFFREGESLSSQFHKYRYEKWRILKGFGVMYADCGARDKRLHKGDVFYVSPYEWHQFKALWPTVVLESQWGLKVSEEDIIREGEFV